MDRGMDGWMDGCEEGKKVELVLCVGVCTGGAASQPIQVMFEK